MTYRKLWTPISQARRTAVSAIAATVLSAAGIGADQASAQQPPPANPPAAAPRPAAPRPAAPKPPAAPAQKPPAATAAPAPAPAAPQAGAPGSAEMPQLVYSPWMKYCGKGKDPGAKEVCFTGKDGRLENGQPVVAAALIEPEGEPRKLLRITLPTGVSLLHGSRIVIDNKDPVAAPFVVCLGNGCMADFEANADFVARLKKGQVLTVQAVNMDGNAFGFPLPLTEPGGNGFTKTNEGPATDPKVMEEQQKKLQEDLQKRADELRRRMESQGGAAAPPK
jgi:invasion protein IalB